MALLSVRDVTLRFGGVVALDRVSFDVEEGQIAGLIGPNGAGKTTAFNVITRLYAPDEGELELDGVSLLRTPAYRIVSRGIARSFQNLNLFRTMTVLENVLLGAHARGRGVGEREALEVLDYVGLGDRAHAPAAALPYGTQKRVELARALIAGPRLLLLDEPSLGLAPLVVREIFRIVRELNEQEGLAVLVVEQDARLALGAAARAYVLEVGQVAVTGTSAELRDNESVRRSYLGY